MSQKIDETDLKQFAEIEMRNMAPILKAIGIHFTEEMLWEDLRENQEFVSISQEGRVVAFMRFQQMEDSAIFIKSIQLASPEKDKVLLRTLLRKFIKKLKTRKFSRLVTTVQKSNKESIRFHERLGFQVDEEFQSAVRFELSREQFIGRNYLRLGLSEENSF